NPHIIPIEWPTAYLPSMKRFMPSKQYLHSPAVDPSSFQNRFARGIARINGDKGLSNFFDQRRIQVTVRREAAVTIARAGPDDPEAFGGQLTLCLQSLDGPPAYRTAIILAPTNPLDDIALIRTGVALAFVIETAKSQSMRRIEP